MNNLHHDHVHTDEYTQTGATLQYYNIQIYVATATSQPVKQKPGVKETRQGARLTKQISGNLKRDNMLMWRTEQHKSHKDSWVNHKKKRENRVHSKNSGVVNSPV